MIMSCQMQPGPEEMKLMPELLIVHLEKLSAPEDVELIDTLRASGLFTIQFVIGPVPIHESVLYP